jgi:succinate dehydrogenase / fumarate reductase, membrane anchor subunit
MSLQSPLGKVLGLGSAKEGAAHWYAQRITAVALAVLGTWFVIALATMDGFELARVRSWLSSPLAVALLLLFVVTLAWHSILGLQVVIEDYIAEPGARVAALVAMKFVFVLAGAVGVIAVLRLAVGAPA